MKRLSEFRTRIAPITNAIRMALCALILFIGTGFLFQVLSPLQAREELRAPVVPRSEMPVSNYLQDFQEILANEQQDILSRNVRIDMTAAQIKGEYVMLIPSTGRLANELTSFRTNENLQAFVELLFGRAYTPDGAEGKPIFDDINSYQHSWTIDSQAKTLRLVISTQKALEDRYVYISFDPSNTIPFVKADQLIIHFDDFRADYLNVIPIGLNLTNNELVIDKQNEPMEHISLILQASSAPEKATSDNPAATTRQLVLQDMDDWLTSIPFLSSIFFAILEVLPLLLFLRIYRSESSRQGSGSLPAVATMITSFLLFHFVLYILSGSTNWFLESKLVASASKFVVEQLGTYYQHVSNQTLKLGPYYFGVIVLGIWMPMIFFNWWGNYRSVSNPITPISIVLLFFIMPVLILFLIGWLVNQYFRLTQGQPAIPSDILSYKEPLTFAIIWTILAVAAIVFTYFDNKKKNNPGWLWRLDQLATFLLSWILWIPPVVAASSFAFIYASESMFSDLTSLSSLVGKIVFLLPLWMWITLFVSCISIALLMAVRGLIKRNVAKELKSRIALYSVGLLIIFGYLEANKLEITAYDLPDRIEWIILLIIFGTLLISSFAFVVLRAVDYLIRKPISTKPQAKWVWLGALVLATPMKAFGSSVGPQSVFFTNLYELAYTLDNLIVFAWLGGVFWFLYQQGKTDAKIDRIDYEIGLLASATMLFSVTSAWFYVPFTFLVGWLGLRFLIRPDQDWTELHQMYQYVRENRNALLERVININVAQASFDDFRKRVSERFSKSSTTTFTKMDQTIIERRKKIDKQIRKSYDFDTHPKDLVFAFGPYESSWENAKHGALWAIIFAIPWLALYMRNFLSTLDVPDTYALLGYLTDLLYILVRWIGMGFTFGYFFPYIRGASGVSKGFQLFLVTFIASLPLAMLYRESSADWRALLFSGLQIFIEFMLLGLVAFDYWTLRKNNRGWQMLFDVHGIAKLGISVSTILAAVGAAIITLLTSQATNLIGVSLKFIFPDLPADFLPK